MRRFAMGCFLCLLAVVTLQAGDEKKPNLDGVWTPKSLTVDGKMVDKEKLQELKLTIKGENYTVHSGEKEINRGTFKVDTSKKPHTIDLVAVAPDGQKITLPGIFKLEKDTLTVCAAPPGKDRPSEFKSEENTGQQLIVYERQKK